MFFSPYSQFAEIGRQYDKLVDSGIFDIVLQHMHQYADTLALQQSSTSMDLDGEIDSRA
jgi:hypothetical protein